ncbi:MAG: putative tRNA threonylcarbamoyladenosine biosynthesis protein Gcp [Parcubacteria group bacterium GW2011_GWD2_38_11]|nr:MAG: putative tRNA threonylcarbamoyladenosine biosynthesis protein Gcp [Parcubacteria group bacterium GW2011_GWD2_38_11]
MSNTFILAIETSCDETAIAILCSSKKGLEILTNQVSSQVKLHAKWGGVVPNLAAREHLKNFPKLLKMALVEAKITPSQLDAISVTSGPGLIPALLVGVNYAKTLSYLWEKPLIGIHHIEGHIYANFISGISNFEFLISNENEKSRIKNIKKNAASIIENCEFLPQAYPVGEKIENSDTIFPVLALVVSGGHTQLVLMKDHLKYEIIGQTVDDAVGEAFDKVARILGIGYPGGPAVARCAQNFQFPISNFQTNSNDQISNDKKKSDDRLLMTDDKKLNLENNEKYNVKFPRPMLNKHGFNFSFSGLKTAVLYETKKNPALLKDKRYIAEVCHEFQQACIDVLVSKTIKAAKLYNPRTILLAGGVSANTELRAQLGDAIAEFIPATLYKIPDISLTGDNAAMIGAAAAFHWQSISDAQKTKALNGWKTLQPDANLKMK